MSVLVRTERYVIPLPQIMNARGFENILRKHFENSLRSKHIKFDMRKTRFCGTFQLSLLLIWIHRITSSKKRKVTLIAPGFEKNGNDYDRGSEPILRYLSSWQFWSALEHVGTSTKVVESQKALRQPKTERILSQHYVPLQFYTARKDYETFLEGLEDEKGLAHVFGQSVSLEIIGSGGLRTIILEEIGKNAFEHGRGKAAHIAIGRMPPVRGATPEEVSEKIRNRASAVPAYARTFFTKLGTDACLEVVISDRGPGIPKTLLNAYLKDQIIPGKKEKPTQDDIIRYAFLLHSSSKAESWYVQSPDPKDIIRYQSPRGLFFVKNIARTNSALLVCRSDRGIASWDFLSSRDGLDSGQKAERQRGRPALTPLGGTQIQLLIPIKEVEKGKRIVVQIPQQLSLAGEKTRKVKVISVAETLRDTRRHPQILAQAVVNKVHKTVLQASYNDIVVLDFLGTRWSKDSLYPIVCELGHLALDRRILGVMHTAHFDAVLNEMVLSHETEQLFAKYVHRRRPFLRLSYKAGHLEVSLLGLPTHDPESDKNIIEMALQGKGSQGIPEALDHFLELDPSGRTALSFDVKHLEIKLNQWRCDVLERMISSPPYHVFHTGRFLLPTSAYVEGFYEIGLLLESPDSATLLQEALIEAYSDVHHANTLLLCISKIGAQVGHLLSKHEKLAGRVEQITLQKPTEIAFLDFDLTNYMRIIVVVDVIATGRSIKLVLDSLRRKYPQENISILSVLDIRPEGMPSDQVDVQNLSFPLRSLFRRPSRFYSEKLRSWSYDEIRRVDPVDWRPVAQRMGKKELWDTKAFLNSACMETGAVRIGHYFHDNGNHYRIFFFTKPIVDQYGEDIIEKIRTEIQDIIDKRENAFVSHILYPKGSIGIQGVAQLLSIHFGGAYIIEVERGGDPRTFVYMKHRVDTVVALDTACSSNRTISYLIDIASEMGANFVFACVMMSRANPQVWRFISQITGYGPCEVFVTALTRVEVPVFDSEWSCPLCQRRKLLQRLQDGRQYAILQSAIAWELERLRPRHINELLKEGESGKGDPDNVEIAYFRLLIEKQRSDTSALTELESKLRSKQDHATRTRQRLLMACGDEAPHIFGEEYGLPRNLHRPFAHLACKVGIESTDENVLRSALEVVLAADQNFPREAVLQYAEHHAQSFRAIEIMLLELLVYVERNPLEATKIAGLLKQIHDKIENLTHSGKIHADVLHLVSTIRRSLVSDVAIQKAKRRPVIKNFQRLLKACQRKRGGIHPFIHESLMKINMVSCPRDVDNILLKYYYMEGGLYDIVFNEILPGVAAMEAVFEILDDEANKYLLPESQISLRTDLWHLDSALGKLQTKAKTGDLSQEDVDRCFFEPSVRQTYERLMLWLGRSGSKLESILTSCICDLSDVIQECCKTWQPHFKKDRIFFKPDIPDKKLEVFVSSRTLRSIADALLGNCLRHGFVGVTREDPAVLIRVVDKSDKVHLVVADNGKGLDSKTNAGVSRVREKAIPFGGNAEIVEMEGYSVCVQTIWEKVEAIT